MSLVQDLCEATTYYNIRLFDDAAERIDEQEREIDRLKAEVADLRRQLASSRETIRMTATESERRLMADNEHIAAARESFMAIARAYLASLDRHDAARRVIAYERELDTVTPRDQDAVESARRERDQRLADLRAAVKEGK